LFFDAKNKMKFYRIKVYHNGVKTLSLGNDSNDSLAILLDRIQNQIQLKEDSFYQFNIYEREDNVLGKGILSTRSGHLDLYSENPKFERCFVCGKNYDIFISESIDTIVVVHIKYKIVPLFIEGKQKFLDWLYMYRFHIQKITINNNKDFDQVNLVEIQKELNSKVNDVIIETK